MAQFSLYMHKDCLKPHSFIYSNRQIDFQMNQLFFVASFWLNQLLKLPFAPVLLCDALNDASRSRGVT